jgi:hypothetical protein
MTVVASSICRTEVAQVQPAAMSSAVKGCGRIRSHLAASAPIFSAVTWSQIAWTAATPATSAKPLSSAVNARPAPAHWRLAYSCPLMIARAVYGK